jgi:hypothetical protein
MRHLDLFEPRRTWPTVKPACDVEPAALGRVLVHRSNQWLNEAVGLLAEYVGES